MNHWGRLALGLCFLAALGLGCGKEKTDTGKDTLVNVNDQAIKTQDLQIAWNSMPDDQRKTYNSPEGIMSLLDELVAYRLMALEAENRKLDQDPLFKKRIEVYRQRLLVNALVDQSMSEADLMNHFQRNFLRARFIRAAFPKDANPAQKAAARAKIEQALAFLATPDADFNDAIEKFSEMKQDESGELGYVTHKTMENMTNFAGADALFNLKEPGQRTGIVEGQDGWYIFELVEPPGKLDVRGLTAELMAGIKDERREQVIRSLASELKSRKEFKITRNEANLAELMKTLEQHWTSIGDSNTAEPGAAPAPAPANPAGSTATPVPGTPAGGTASPATAPGGTQAPKPAPAVPAEGATPAAPKPGTTTTAP